MCNRQIPQKLLLWIYFRLTCFGPRTILKGHNITHQLTAEVCIVKGKGEVPAVQVIKAHRELGLFVHSALNGDG